MRNPPHNPRQSGDEWDASEVRTRRPLPSDLRVQRWYEIVAAELVRDDGTPPGGGSAKVKAEKACPFARTRAVAEFLFVAPGHGIN